MDDDVNSSCFPRFFLKKRGKQVVFLVFSSKNEENKKNSASAGEFWV